MQARDVQERVMAKMIEMPKLSPTMEEGQISAWHKKEGDAVAVDEVLAEVETDKATMEFRSFDKGTLLKILAPEGSMVKLGQPVAIIGEKGEDVSKLTGGDAAPAKEEKKEAADESGHGHGQDEEKAEGEEGEEKKEEEKGEKKEEKRAEDAERAGDADEAPAEGRLKASPYVRKLARERGLSLTRVRGSGPHGRIIARDLDSVSKEPAASKPGAAAQKSPSSGAQPESTEGRSAAESTEGRSAPESKPLSMMRKTIAKRLTESKQTVPHFYLTIDVDAEALHLLREQINADLAASVEKDAKEPAPKVSFNDLVIKAVAIALVRVPTANAQFTPEAILYHKRVDISVAVAVEDGLLTPVVRDANTKSVLGIAREVRELAGKARSKKLKPEEMSGGTFSISNLGMFGIDEFSAVINPPEGAILAVGQVRREPVVRGDAVVPGRRMAMTMSCDHRVIDGAVGATFLKALRSLLEHPAQILVL